MKKKILFIVQLPPPVHGASLMNEYAYKSPLIRSQFNCAIIPLQFADSIADIGTFGFKKLWKMLLFCCRLFFKLITFRPHLVYFTLAPVGSAFYRDALFTLVIRCMGIKRLYHLHGKGIREEASSSSFKRALYTFTFQKSQVIILAASLQKDIESVFTGKPFVLPNGVPATECIKTENNLGIPVFLYLSNLVRSKGIDIFLQSLLLVHQQKREFFAYIVGAPYDISIEEVKRFIDANGMTHKVKVMGPVYGSEKQQIICRSNILVFPSSYKNEAFPLTLLEAMQAQLAVIACDNGAIHEIVDEGKTGFIAPVNDVQTLSDKMDILLNNPEVVREMGRNGKEKFEQFFTIEKFENKLFEIFKQVLP